MSNRTYDIDDPNIPHRKVGTPFVKIGMLVTITGIQNNHRDNIPFWKNKHHAVVTSLGWSLCDWGEDGWEPNRSKWYVVPFTRLVWDDGGETNTSQNVLVVLSKVK